jgi:uncharacterized membrane protein
LDGVTAILFGSRRGQAILLLVTAAGPVLAGAMGLAIDVAQLYFQRQMAQAAADAAAVSGMMSIFQGTNTASNTGNFSTSGVQLRLQHDDDSI